MLCRFASACAQGPALAKKMRKKAFLSSFRAAFFLLTKKRQETASACTDRR